MSERDSFESFKEVIRGVQDNLEDYLEKQSGVLEKISQAMKASQDSVVGEVSGHYNSPYFTKYDDDEAETPDASEIKIIKGLVNSIADAKTGEFNALPDLPPGWHYSAKIHNVIFVCRDDEFNSETIFAIIEDLNKIEEDEWSQEQWKNLLALIEGQIEAFDRLHLACTAMRELFAKRIKGD